MGIEYVKSNVSDGDDDAADDEEEEKEACCMGSRGLRSIEGGTHVVRRRRKTQRSARLLPVMKAAKAAAGSACSNDIAVQNVFF